MKKKRVAGRLILEDGSEFPGEIFGKAKSQAGEVVFTTGMSGYPQSLSDPSFRGQILVATYPLIGNYGLPFDTKSGAIERDEHGIPLHYESDRVQVGGLVVSELCDEPSHFASTSTLAAWLEYHQVPGIQGVDTRALTERLREHGVMRGKIVVDGARAVSMDSGDLAHPVADVSPKEVREYRSLLGGGDSATATKSDSTRRPRIALVDCGAKANILRCLLARDVDVIQVPWDHDLEGIDYDGVFLSNGPGDPKTCQKTIATVRKVIKGSKPLFGICLGNQILALASGADTWKLPYGHRGVNQPCLEVGSKRCYITSQNHGYAVRAESIPRGWEPWFVNTNDDTIEGIKSSCGRFKAVQFHPEGCPGPRDTEFLIDNFVMEVRAAAGLEAPLLAPLVAGETRQTQAAALAAVLAAEASGTNGKGE